MLLLRHIPAAPLAAHVNCFWYSRGHVPEPRRVRSLPSGCADLTFNLHENRIRMFRDEADRDGLIVNGAIVHGVQSRYFVLDARREAHVIGVHFRPGGAAALLGLPAGELSNRHVSLEDIWGSRAVRLREQLLEASEPPSPALRAASPPRGEAQKERGDASAPLSRRERVGVRGSAAHSVRASILITDAEMAGTDGFPPSRE